MVLKKIIQGIWEQKKIPVPRKFPSPPITFPINKENSTESICDEFYEKNEETEQRKRYESTSCLRQTL